MTAPTRATFGHSDPSWRVELSLPDSFVTHEHVEAGDIIFARRPRGYQRLAAVAGDTWRHVGVVAMMAGNPWMLEMTPFGYSARPLTSVLEMYDSVALQRLPPCQKQCNRHLVPHIALQMNVPTHFHNRIELGTIGLSSLLRLRAFHALPFFRRLGQLLREFLDSRSGVQERAICSTPLANSLRYMCNDHRVALDVLGQKEDGPHIELHGMGAPSLAMPDDIWRALQSTTPSYWLKCDHLIPEVDMTQPIELRETAKLREEVPA